MRRRLFLVVLLLVVGGILAACTAEPETIEVTRVVTETIVQEGETVEVTRIITETEVESVEVTRVVTEIEEVLVEAEPEPVDRNGAWLDTLVVVEEPEADAAITRLLANDIDIYAYQMADLSAFQRVQQSPELSYVRAYGSYDDLTFNPSEFDNGKLNPFVSAKIREAMNWLVDREYIAQEIMGGLAVPRYVDIAGASADRGRLAAAIRQVEAAYGYDPERAAAVISEEMENLGATLEGGVWVYNGEPVEIKLLIRTEDERLEIGDYVGNQLEDLGFTTSRDYRNSTEAGTVWIQGNPADGEFHIYTGGWVASSISRDEGQNFLNYHTPVGWGIPLWQAYSPTAEFTELAQRLYDNDFVDLDERSELMAQILPLQMQNAMRMYLVDETSFTPFLKDVQVSYDLSGGVYGSNFWPYTLRWPDEVGGSMTWAMPSILTQPWNPIAGTNWIYDQALIRATNEYALYNDPATGLNWPHRVESAEIFVQEGLPVGRTLEWVDLQFVPENVVPDDTWVDWDAASQTFITAGEAFAEPQTAILKTVVHYPDDLYQTVKWHDGSNFSAGDIVLAAIMHFDLSKPESPYFDEATVPAFEAWMSTFKGFRIPSTDPLIVEYYTDNWQLDSEESFADYWGNGTGSTATLWPSYAQGEAAWHALMPGLMAEEKLLAALSADKADANEIDWLNYISGPTVDILAEQLAEAADGSLLPFAPTLSQYISADEIASRYANLQEWFRRRGHFWIGTGPYYLQRAFPVEGTVILERNPEFPDSANRWDRFAAPAVAEVEVDGPGRVTIGEEAVFDVFIDFQEVPYASDDIKEVQFLLFDATGQMVASGYGEAVEDGLCQVTLSSDITSELETGSNRLEIVVVSKLVALPSLAEFPFVTAP